MRTPIILSLCFSAISGCAAALENGPAEPASLITGDWSGFRVVGPAPCPPSAICLSGIVEGSVGRVRTLSGPRVPRSITARMEVHAHPVRARIVLLVRPPRPGARAWRAQWLTGGPAGERGCVEAAILAENGVAVPRGAEVRDDTVCFVM
jgi:hypothetical protein